MVLIALRLARAQIARRPRRAALVVTTVAAGLSVLVFLRALSDGWIAQRLAGLSAGHARVLGTEQAPLTPERVDALLLRLQEADAVLAAAPRLSAVAWIRHGERSGPARLLGIDPEREVAAGWLSAETAALVGGSGPQALSVLLARDVAAALRAGPGSELGLLFPASDGLLVGERGRVAGLIDTPGWRGAVLVARADLGPRLARAGADDEIALRLTPSAAELRSVQAVVADLARATATPLTAWPEDTPELLAGIETLTALERLRQLVIFALVALGLHAVLAMVVVERRREFAVLAAVGLPRHTLCAAMLAETALLAAAGLLVGLAATAATVQLWLGSTGLDLALLGARLPEALGEETRLFPRIGAANLAQATAFTALVALLVPLPTLLRVARLDPAEALRSRE